jgi:hypothetical protein
LASLSPKHKIKIILTKGKPFLTLVHKPGHIMLYLGHFHGQPMVFQDAWGLPTRNLFGMEGRNVIGKTAITPLTLGEGHSNIPHNLLFSVDGITDLTHPRPIPTNR